MKKLLVGLTIIFTTILIYSCSGNGIGPDPGNGNGGGEQGERRTYNVSVSVTPSDAGSISPSTNGTYEQGEEIELLANPSEGYLFTGWTGDKESSDNPLSLTVNKDYSLTANFEVKSYALTVNKTGKGAVSEEIIQTKAKEYAHGTVVELTASPAEGYKFMEWKGAITTSENPVQIMIDSPKEVMAVFAEIPFEGGDGSEANPYKVSTIEQLQEIGNHLNAHFIQINNIDASLTSKWNEGKGFEPIGDGWNNPFTGTYNGNGYKISNLEINRNNSYDVALFAVIEGSTIKNVALENVKITGGSATAGLVGTAFNSEIINSSVSGTIKGTDNVGGLIATLRDETSQDGYVIPSSTNKVVDSHSIVNVKGVQMVGGLVGYVSGNSKVLRSYSKSTITVIQDSEMSNADIGGLAGANWGEIRYSFSDGRISATEKVTLLYVVGGLVGINTNSGIIDNSYSILSIQVDSSFTNLDRYGGLVGINTGAVINSFAAGSISGANNHAGGGFIAENKGNTSANYWDIEATGMMEGIAEGSINGITGLTTSEMTGTAAKNNMLDLDWTEVWVITNGYPALFWE